VPLWHSLYIQQQTRTGHYGMTCAWSEINVSMSIICGLSDKISDSADREYFVLFRWWFTFITDISNNFSAFNWNTSVILNSAPRCNTVTWSTVLERLTFLHILFNPFSIQTSAWDSLKHLLTYCISYILIHSMTKPDFWFQLLYFLTMKNKWMLLLHVSCHFK
jgi:hypothetical protein